MAVIVSDRFGNVQAWIEGKRASANLDKLDASLFKGEDLPSGNWLFFSRLINSTGEKGLGTELLDTVLAYAKVHSLSIINPVNAYGGLTQTQLEEWYLRKGFRPLDYNKYKNRVLIWTP